VEGVVSTIYLVDDDEVFSRALSRLLRACAFDVRVFSSGATLLNVLSPSTRGCIIADLHMPELGGLELQEALAKAGILLPLVFLTGQADIPSTVRAMQGGAVDFLEKGAAKETLLAAVNRALEREAASHAERAKHDALRSRFSALTGRELEVLQLVVRGKMNKETAAELGIHERTVKLHRTAITSKVGVHSVAELTDLVRQAGLFSKAGHAEAH